MSIVDFLIFGLYMASVLRVRYYHFRRNKNADGYYVGNRNIHDSHVGLSIVATDVGVFFLGIGLAESVRQVDLYPSAYGIAVSLIVFVFGSSLFPDRNVNLQKGEIGV